MVCVRATGLALRSESASGAARLTVGTSTACLGDHLADQEHGDGDNAGAGSAGPFQIVVTPSDGQTVFDESGLGVGASRSEGFACTGTGNITATLNPESNVDSDSSGSSDTVSVNHPCVS